MWSKVAKHVTVSNNLTQWFKYTGDYLLGGRTMGLVPVSISLVVSYVSSITFLGISAEIYYFGAHMAFFFLAHVIGAILSAVLFVPLLYPLKITSANEVSTFTLHWRHNGRDGVSNLEPHDCLLNRLFRRRSKKTSELRVTGLCVGNSPVTGEFHAQRASNAKNVSIWWRHHEFWK